MFTNKTIALSHDKLIKGDIGNYKNISYLYIKDMEPTLYLCLYELTPPELILVPDLLFTNHKVRNVHDVMDVFYLPRYNSVALRVNLPDDEYDYIVTTKRKWVKLSNLQINSIEDIHAIISDVIENYNDIISFTINFKSTVLYNNLSFEDKVKIEFDSEPTSNPIYYKKIYDWIRNNNYDIHNVLVKNKLLFFSTNEDHLLMAKLMWG